MMTAALISFLVLPSQTKKSKVLSLVLTIGDQCLSINLSIEILIPESHDL